VNVPTRRADPWAVPGDRRVLPTAAYLVLGALVVAATAWSA